MIRHKLVLRHDQRVKKAMIKGDVESLIKSGIPRLKYMKQIMIDVKNDGYKKLKELIYKR